MGIEINLWWQELLERTARDIATERVEKLKEEKKLPANCYAYPVSGYGESFAPTKYRPSFRFEVHGHSAFEVPVSEVLRRVLDSKRED